MHRGYIKLWRKVKESFIMKDSEAFHLFLTLVMAANHKEHQHFFNNQKVVIKRGQLITGRHTLSIETGIKQNKIYRLLNCFENEQLIEQQKTNRYSIISIVCYEQYQSNEQPNEQQIDNRSTTDRQQIDTLKELININKNDNNNIAVPGGPAKDRGLAVQPAKRSAYHRAIDLFCQKYQETQGVEYIITNWGKQTKNIKPIVHSMNIPQFSLAVDNYMDSDLGRSKSFSLDFFVSSINQWRPKDE